MSKKADNAKDVYDLKSYDNQDPSKLTSQEAKDAVNFVTETINPIPFGPNPLKLEGGLLEKRP